MLTRDKNCGHFTALLWRSEGKRKVGLQTQDNMAKNSGEGKRENVMQLAGNHSPN